MNRRELLQKLAAAGVLSATGLPALSASDADAPIDVPFDDEILFNPSLLRYAVPSQWRGLCDQLDLVRMNARNLFLLSREPAGSTELLNKNAVEELAELCLRGMEHLASADRAPALCQSCADAALRTVSLLSQSDSPNQYQTMFRKMLRSASDDLQEAVAMHVEPLAFFSQVS